MRQRITAISMVHSCFLDGDSTTPLREGLEAFGFAGAAFFGFRASLVLLRWPFATAISPSLLSLRSKIPLGLRHGIVETGIPPLSIMIIEGQNFADAEPCE